MTVRQPLIGLVAVTLTATAVLPGQAETPLRVVYPPDDHQTTAEQIFLIGTGDATQPVLVNGEPIEFRSATGHFAPSYPLEVGENPFVLTQGEETVTLTVTRLAQSPPEGTTFLEGSLLPTVDIARQPGELVCLGAIAPPNAQVSASLRSESIALTPQIPVDLPPNSAVLTGQNTPQPQGAPTAYEGCFVPEGPGNLGAPTYSLSLNGQTTSQQAAGKVEILAPTPFEIAQVTANSGTARTGPSTNYSRLTPLPRGTRAAITGREGDWLRLDYGAWIRASEVETFSSAAPPTSIIRSVSSRQIPGWTEVRFPLQTAVPISLEQTADTLTLTLYNTTPQTDTIYVDNDPVVERLDWQPILPDQAEYTFRWRDRPWGYQTRYEGTTLVLSLRHPPELGRALEGTTILLDPGHGGEELGARGPDGTPEKAVNLRVSELLRQELESRGATVVMTRTEDVDVSLGARMDQIAQVEPTVALSIHYNALPDSGDAINTAGVGMFWYHAQAHDLAAFLHDYLVETLDRPSYGVFWNNLALTRPNTAPSVLLELGFMINPTEFEWITDPASQRQLATTLADGLELWIRQHN
ncbi:N-acetylmuramoyl-L-alanine amidase [filamentous cyanobacterium CCP5]|nr:N-acetylmuramoyl-L-alanine amidase [filamentous cyanobacterium CCP5]